MYWDMGSKIQRNTEQSARARQHFGYGRYVWVQWKMKNDDSPSMQSIEKMNSTSTLEEILGECIKKQPEDKNMNSEPLYTSQRHEENIAERITRRTYTQRIKIKDYN